MLADERRIKEELRKFGQIGSECPGQLEKLKTRAFYLDTVLQSPELCEVVLDQFHSVTIKKINIVLFMSTSILHQLSKILWFH